MSRTAPALLAALLLAEPALAGSGVEGDSATSAPESPPAPWSAPVAAAAGDAALDRCAGATWIWRSALPEGGDARRDANFAYESFVMALLGREMTADETEAQVEARVERLMQDAVMRYLATFPDPAWGGSAEGLLQADLAVCAEVLEAQGRDG
ncbi:MAG TPA: hypothetical protein VJ994_01690 [Paracoccaceae bacterium]|nr:hypothetical protein [Paracoccaceae bacterium]